MAARLIRLRYSATCSMCRSALAVATTAWWDAEARAAMCVLCAANDDGETQDPRDEGNPREPSKSVENEAGASAQREYLRRTQKREAEIEQRWGRLAGVVKFLSDDPQSTKAWAKGSEGERRLAASLAKHLGNRAVLLHDRKSPGTRRNIDHLAIASSGVWVIDAKTYKGVVERRDRGRWFTTNYRLYVGGRDRTNLATGIGWQIEAVRTALDPPTVPIVGVVCFVDAEWKLFAKPFQLDGVWVTWGKKLAEMIAKSGPLTEDRVMDVAHRLALALPPATT